MSCSDSSRLAIIGLGPGSCLISSRPYFSLGRWQVGSCKGILGQGQVLFSTTFPLHFAVLVKILILLSIPNQLKNISEPLFLGSTPYIWKRKFSLVWSVYSWSIQWSWIKLNRVFPVHGCASSTTLDRQLQHTWNGPGREPNREILLTTWGAQYIDHPNHRGTCYPLPYAGILEMCP